MVDAIYEDDIEVGILYDTIYGVVIGEDHYTFVVQIQ